MNKMNEINEINDKIIATLKEMIVLKDQQITDLKEHIKDLNKVLEDALSLCKTV